jgi:toxin CcdB
MPQFTVHRNLSPATKAAVPFLLDVQSDFIAELGTRVVVPLHTAVSMKGKTIRTLTPVLEVEGKNVVMVTPQLAGIPKKSLGPAVCDLSVYRDEIIAALDLLITGI